MLFGFISRTDRDHRSLPSAKRTFRQAQGRPFGKPFDVLEACYGRPKRVERLKTLGSRTGLNVPSLGRFQCALLGTVNPGLKPWAKFFSPFGAMRRLTQRCSNSR